MAQQTINIGASPNDGTGTPLRTAFQYTNSNFSELYTAVGPSGNNIVCPGSATITGDLTVDTNVLKVDSTNNRVGINTATPVAGIALHVCDNVFGANLSSGVRFGNSGNNYYYDQLIVTDAGSNPSYQLKFATHTLAKYLYGGGTNYWEWYTNNTLAMTLNSTGLGVGLTPSGGAAGSVFSAGAVLAAGGLTANQTNRGVLGYSSNETTIRSYGATAGTGFITFRVAGGGGSGDTEAMRIDASSNVGIGVTPSYKLDVRGSDNSVIAQFGGTNRQVRLSTSAVSAVDNTSFNFIHTSGSGRFTFQNNSGTQTMLTIDDNGNNILRMPVTPPTLGVNFEGTFNLTSNTNLRISVRGSDGVTRVANITLA